MVTSKRASCDVIQEIGGDVIQKIGGDVIQEIGGCHTGDWW